MSHISIAFAGMDRSGEEEIRSIFERANAAVGGMFQPGPEDSAQVLVVDVDSIHGHMTWIRMQNAPDRTVVAVSARQAPHAEHCLVQPVSVEALSEVLADIAGQPGAAHAPEVVVPLVEGHSRTASPAPVAGAEPAPITEATEASDPQVEAAEGFKEDADATAGGTPAEPAPPAPPRLGDYLVAGALSGPSRLSLPGAPDLVVDPGARAYIGPAQLKGFAAYAQAAQIAPSQWQPLSADALASLAASHGTPQPWARLAWLSGLYRSPGELAPGYRIQDRFALLKWPQIEREFPRHFRIATSMMKAPATAPEIAEASGAPLEEVIDFINASIAAGQAERVVEQAVPAEPPARGAGLLGRLKGLRGN